jgi:hypothetical protein
MISWIPSKLLYVSRIILRDDAALPEDIRKLYKYTGRASKTWMDTVLLSPYASHKQVIQQPSRNRLDRFSCCIYCETHLASNR